MSLTGLPMPSTFIEQIAEEHPHTAAELAVGEIQNHERQREYPKKADGESQEEIDEPQGQQTGYEGHDWIFNQVVHFLIVDLLMWRFVGLYFEHCYFKYCCILPMSS
jgi:hypothetical protein